MIADKLFSSATLEITLARLVGSTEYTSLAPACAHKMERIPETQNSSSILFDKL